MIIIAVLLFELIIFIHELGHFIAAKKCGVKVNEFSLGMGPRLFGFTKGETTYSFRAFPIGGFCAMEGEDGPEEDVTLSEEELSELSEEERAGLQQFDAAVKEQELEASLCTVDEAAAPAAELSADGEAALAKDTSRPFYNASVWKRMIIIIAGATMNIVLGLVLMFVTLIPKDTFVSTDVAMTQPVSFSTITGLQPGDQIVKINGYDVNTYTDFSFQLYTLPLSDIDSDDLSIYKEDCLFNLYTYIVGYQEIVRQKELAPTLNQLLMDVQPLLYAARDQDEAFRVYSEAFAQATRAGGGGTCGNRAPRQPPALPHRYHGAPRRRAR